MSGSWQKVLGLLFLSCLMASCGYRPGYGSGISGATTLSVPYVEGDVDGSLTAAIIYSVANSASFEHRSTNGELLLIVKQVDIDDENIGFRYDHLHHRHGRHSLVPVEARLRMVVEMSLVEAATGCSIIPTVRLSASVDFDHEYNAMYHDANVFSLGQLSDADSAFAAARCPLNRRIAEKIVDYITYNR